MSIIVDGLTITQPTLPSMPNLPGISAPDHIAFVARARDEETVLRFWEERGYTRLKTIVTTRFPARHTGLIRSGRPHEPMIALSTSLDAASPILRLIRKRGETSTLSNGGAIPGLLQHVAYSVEEGYDIRTVTDLLIRRNLTNITPILKTEKANGWVRQVLLAESSRQTGHFLELVQRHDLAIANAAGEQEGFAGTQIDKLYEKLAQHYDRFRI